MTAVIPIQAAPYRGPAHPRVLVLLAAHNGAHCIREQLESILAQESVEVRVVVRDDASTDNTRWELARFAHDTRVAVTSGTAASGSAARNFLTLVAENAAAGFDCVAFADQDDRWNPDKLARACRVLAAGAAEGYSSATLAVWQNGRRRVLAPSGAPTSSDFLFEGAGQGCTFVLSAALYERVRRFLAAHADLTQQLHYHDWMVYALARVWGLQWHFDAQPSMQYRQHAGNDTGARGTAGGVARRLDLIRRGWYRAQLGAIAGICSAAAPTNATVLAWQAARARPDGWRRRLRLAHLCLQGGRRRKRDNLVAVLAALCGWL
jgi:rhamnosyltransferase